MYVLFKKEDYEFIYSCIMFIILKKKDKPKNFKEEVTNGEGGAGNKKTRWKERDRSEVSLNIPCFVDLNLKT